MTLDEFYIFKNKTLAKTDAANIHDVSNCLASIRSIIELDRPHLFHYIDIRVAEIEKLLKGAKTKAGSRKHRWPTWVLVNGD